MTAPGRVELVRAALWAARLDRRRTSWPGWPGYEVVEVGRGEAGELAATMGVPPGVVLERFGRGARPWAARSPRGGLVAWLWVSVRQEQAPPIRRTLVFAADEAYGWDAGTLPTHRGRGLFTTLLERASLAMSCEGRSVMWGGIHDHNLASQRANLAAGFRPALRLTALLLGGRSLIRTRAVDYAEPDLVERGRQLLAGCGGITSTGHGSGLPAVPAGRSQRRNRQ